MNRFVRSLIQDLHGPGRSAAVRLLVESGDDAPYLLDLAVDYENQLGGDAAEAYERLLGDALAGDTRLFARQDSVEEAWRIVQPLLDAPPETRLYRAGTWGPPEADELLPSGFRWDAQAAP